MNKWKKKEKQQESESKKANIKQVKEGFPSFNEYLSSTGKTVEKPPVENVPDYKGPHKNSPDKPGTWPEDVDNKGKKKIVGSPSPYSGPGTDPGLPKGESGLGDDGPKELVYDPDTKVNQKEMEKSSWPKSKTEAFLASTKDMSISEFVKFMSERTVHGGPEYEAVKYIASNPIALQSLVRETKRAKNLNIMLEALLQLPEMYPTLLEILSKTENSQFRNALKLSLLEAVGPPFHKLDGPPEEMDDNDNDDDMDDMDDDPDADSDDMGDEDMDDGEEGDLDFGDDDDDEDDMDNDDDSDDEPLDSVDHGDESPLDKEMTDKLRKFLSKY